MTPSAQILQASNARPFRDAVTLGQGFPTEILGQPCKYVRKEILPLGKYLDNKKEEFTIDPARVERLITNFNRAKAKSGFTPFLPPDHKTRRGDANFGFIVGMDRNERGSLEGIFQLIGEDAALAASRNKVSICTVRDVVDEHGNVFDELVDHVAILPDPQLNGLESFTPAIAASRGSVPATFFTLAAQKEETMPDLKKLRATLKAAETLADEAVIELALSRIAEAEPIAAQLATAKTDLMAARAEATDAKSKLATSEGKVLELSRGLPKAPDEDTLLLLADSFNTEREAAISAGGISLDTAKEIDKLLMAEGKPNSLALSRAPGSPQPLAKRFWQIMRNNKLVPTGERTGMQFGRQTPVDDPNQKSEKELADAGRAQGKAYADAAGAKA